MDFRFVIFQRQETNEKKADWPKIGARILEKHIAKHINNKFKIMFVS